MNLEKIGVLVLKDLVILIVFIALSSSDCSVDDGHYFLEDWISHEDPKEIVEPVENVELMENSELEVSGEPFESKEEEDHEDPVASKESTIRNAYGTFTIRLEAWNVTTAVFGYPSTKVLYSVFLDRAFIHPSTLYGGRLIGGEMIPPTNVILRPLISNGNPVGWLIGLDGISGNTFSYMVTLVVPSRSPLGFEYHAMTFLAKELPVTIPCADGLEIWSRYQEWGGKGTASSFFVPELRKIQFDAEGEAKVFLDKLPPAFSKWPLPAPFSFLGLYVGGAANLNPELMEASLERFEPEDASVCKIHGLPEDREGLSRMIEEVRRTRMLVGRLGKFNLDCRCSNRSRNKSTILFESFLERFEQDGGFVPGTI